MRGSELKNRINSLKNEHFDLELKIEQLTKKPLLTNDEQYKIKNLKKLKLLTKDKIFELSKKLENN